MDKLAAGRSATLSMVLVPPLEATVFNVSAQVKSAIPDPVPENNFVTMLDLEASRLLHAASPEQQFSSGLLARFRPIGV